jgi:hypothetical protein
MYFFFNKETIFYEDKFQKKKIFINKFDNYSKIYIFNILLFLLNSVKNRKNRKIKKNIEIIKVVKRNYS